MEDRTERAGRRNLRAAVAGRMKGEGQDRTDRHKEFEPEGERTRMIEQGAVEGDNLAGHSIAPEVGCRKHLDPGSHS